MILLKLSVESALKSPSLRHALILYKGRKIPQHMSCYYFYGIGFWIVNISFREMLEI